MRQAPFAVVLVALALSPVPVRSQDAPSATGPQLTTTVRGSAPDLAGRWLVVAQVTPPGQQTTIPVVYRWEVTAPGGKPELAFRWGDLPPAVQASLDAATARRERWEPTPQQLEAVRDGWDTAGPGQAPAASIETTISGADAMPEALQRDTAMAGSAFTVQAVVTYPPGSGRAVRDAIVLGAKEALPDGYSGSFLSTTVVAAPFPVPVSVAGTFRMYRLDPAAPLGWLRRLLDGLAGCGRTPRS